MHSGGLDDDQKDSAATHITLRPQLGGHRQCGLAICTFHLGFSLGMKRPGALTRRSGFPRPRKDRPGPPPPGQRLGGPSCGPGGGQSQTRNQVLVTVVDTIKGNAWVVHRVVLVADRLPDTNRPTGQVLVTVVDTIKLFCG